jgi:hypothetical protein
MAETTILAKWISLEPSLHGELWFAQSEDRELTAIREQEKHLGMRQRNDVPADQIIQTIEDKTGLRDEALVRAKAAGKKYDRPMPPLARLVEEIEKAEPGHKTVMRQTYDIIYRALSPWMHTEAASFKSTARVTDEGSQFLGDRSPYNVEHLRLMACGQFAYVLELLGMASKDDSALTARIIRTYLIVYRPPGGQRVPWRPGSDQDA